MGAAGDICDPDVVMGPAGLGFVWIVLSVAAIPALHRMPAPMAVEPIQRDVLAD